MLYKLLGIVGVQLLSRVRLNFGTPRAAACQSSLFLNISRSLLKLMSIESVMPSNHLILCHPLFLLASIFPRIRIFSKESVLCIRCPKYWSFSISPSNEYSGSISLGLTGLSPDELTSKGLRSSSVAQWVEPGFGTRQLWGHDLATTKLSESQLPHEQKVSKIIFFTEFL